MSLDCRLSEYECRVEFLELFSACTNGFLKPSRSEFVGIYVIYSECVAVSTSATATVTNPASHESSPGSNMGGDLGLVAPITVLARASTDLQSSDGGSDSGASG